MGLFGPIVTQNSKVLGSIRGRDGCLSSGLCVYKVFQTVQKSGVCRFVYGTVHYKKPLKSFDKSRA